MGREAIIYEVSFDHFTVIFDPRQEGKVQHKLRMCFYCRGCNYADVMRERDGGMDVQRKIG